MFDLRSKGPRAGKEEKIPPANTGLAASLPLCIVRTWSVSLKLYNRGEEAASPVLAGGISSSLPALVAGPGIRGKGRWGGRR